MNAARNGLRRIIKSCWWAFKTLKFSIYAFFFFPKTEVFSAGIVGNCALLLTFCCFLKNFDVVFKLLHFILIFLPSGFPKVRILLNGFCLFLDFKNWFIWSVGLDVKVEVFAFRKLLYIQINFGHYCWWCGNAWRIQGLDWYFCSVQKWLIASFDFKFVGFLIVKVFPSYVSRVVNGCYRFKSALSIDQELQMSVWILALKK